jgi:hypothetical protein
LFYAVPLMSVWSQPSTTIAGSASPMAKEFTSDIVERKNLAYVTQGGPSQTLDLYAPKKAKQVPLIVWIHGGAFLFGSKEGFPVEPVPLHLLLEGYAVASINYRLSPEAVFPAQLEDCKAAIRWLRAHACQATIIIPFLATVTFPDRFGANRPGVLCLSGVVFCFRWCRPLAAGGWRPKAGTSVARRGVLRA